MAESTGAPNAPSGPDIWHSNAEGGGWGHAREFVGGCEDCKPPLHGMARLRDVLDGLAIDAAWTRHTKQLLTLGPPQRSGSTRPPRTEDGGASDTGGSSA